MTIKKKRNPTDATLRNIRALKKRIKALEDEVFVLREFMRKHVRSEFFNGLGFEQELAKIMEAHTIILSQKQAKK